MGEQPANHITDKDFSQVLDVLRKLADAGESNFLRINVLTDRVETLEEQLKNLN
jgi:hypothetical protein